VALTAADWDFMEQQAKARPPKAGDEPPARDMVIKEGDTITLGDTKLKVYVLPGHTPGSPAFEFTVYDNKKPVQRLRVRRPGSAQRRSGGNRVPEEHRAPREGVR
jgi:hypothetical protein